MTEVVEFLKRNHDEWFSVKEVSDNIDKNIRTVRSNVRDLVKRNMVIRKQVNVGGKVGVVTKYRFASTDDAFECYKKIHHQGQLLVHQRVLGDYMTAHTLQVMTIDELQQIKSLLKQLVDGKRV